MKNTHSYAQKWVLSGSGLRGIKEPRIFPFSCHCGEETPHSYMPDFCYTFSDKDAYNEPIIFISSDPLFS